MPRPFSPDEFAYQMEQIAKNGDIEDAHGEADDLMVDTLRRLGYERGLAIFEKMDKWYA